MNQHRAVITGIGCITPIGTGAQALWEGILRGRSAIRRIDRFDAAGCVSRLAAQADDFDPVACLGHELAGRLDRSAQFALVAAGQALGDAGLNQAELDGDRVGVFIGSALGAAGSAEAQHSAYLSGGLPAVNPDLALSVLGGAPSSAIAMAFGFHGPNETNAMSCASGAIALGRALRTIRTGEADVVLSGGTEAPLAPLCYGAFAAIRAMSTRNEEPETACRPFDRNRDGFVLGEGAAVLVLESWEHAQRRGARAYAELAGYGTAGGGGRLPAPDPDGAQAARAITACLADALLCTDHVGYINAHASATPRGDVAEAQAIHRALGSVASEVPVSGTKGLYGHPLGAAGAVEAAITALALHHGYMPPTVNLQEPDPGLDLTLVTGEGRESRCRWALSNSFGLGGINACLALGNV